MKTREATPLWRGTGQRSGPGLASGWRALLGAILGVCILLPGIGLADPAAQSPPLVVRLALQWKPQSQFAGYYLARDKGLYGSAGLDVRLLHASYHRTSLRMLQDGSADLATLFLADAILAAGEGATESAPGVRPVQLMQLVQRSNLMLVAWKDAGIGEARDLSGQRVSYWPGSFSTAFQAFFAANGGTPEVFPQYYSVGLFLKRGVAACAAMEYNEYHRIWQAGIDFDRLLTFRMRDYGLGFPEDGLYAPAGWIERNPQAARALRTATAAGWSYARAHPEEALDTVMAETRKAGLSANRPHERWMLAHILDSIFVGGDSAKAPGELDPAEYARTVQALQAAGLLQRAPELSAFAPLEGTSP